MSNAIPSPLRAVAGLAAITIDEARRLPSRLVGLPVSAASTALQASLKVQQQYAGLIVRGDELLAGLKPQPEEAPPWATFDDEPAGDVTGAAVAEDVAAPPVVEDVTAGPVVEDMPEPILVDDEASIAEPPGVADLPLVGYDTLTVAQVRARLRKLSPQQVQTLLDYESANEARAAYLTTLANRLETLRSS